MPTTPESYGRPLRPGSPAQRPAAPGLPQIPQQAAPQAGTRTQVPMGFPGQANGGVFPGQGRGVEGGFPGGGMPRHSQPMPPPVAQRAQPMPMPQMPMMPPQAMGGGIPAQMPPQAFGGGQFPGGGMGQADPAQRAMQRVQGLDLPPHVLEMLMSRFGQ